MLESLGLFVALVLMLVPFVNIAIGALVWGWPGFFAGIIILLIMDGWE